MKGKPTIPIWQLKQNISGVRIERIDETFISSLFEDISKLHRNDHFICLMLKSGSAELLVDFKKVQVVPRKIIFLFPGQVQRAVAFKKNSDGWILFLDNKLVDGQAMMMIEDSLIKGPVLSLTAADIKWFTQYFELLLQTYNDEALGIFHKSSVNAFIAPCVYKIASAFRDSMDAVTSRYSQRSVELTKTFKRLVRQQYLAIKRPGDYAALMNISLTYLNDTIRSVTGFSATYIIQQEMLREAQRLLCYTDLSIKEISARMGYEDEKYFNRIFTKLAGLPPGRFRNNFKSHE